MTAIRGSYFLGQIFTSQQAVFPSGLESIRTRNETDLAGYSAGKKTRAICQASEQRLRLSEGNPPILAKATWSSLVLLP